MNFIPFFLTTFKRCIFFTCPSDTSDNSTVVTVIQLLDKMLTAHNYDYNEQKFQQTVH